MIIIFLHSILKLRNTNMQNRSQNRSQNSFTRSLIFTAVLAFGIASSSFLRADENHDSPKKAKPRPIPYRGVVGNVDLEKGIFILKNKRNDLIRTFKITPKTRFEEMGQKEKIKRELKDLKPDMMVRGSCEKTGNRQYLARLVRWNSPVQEKDVKDSSNNSSKDSSSNSRRKN